MGKALSLIIAGVLLVCGGGYFGVTSFLDKQEIDKGVPSFNEMTEEQFEKAKFVEGDVEFALGAYAETYTTNYGIRTSKKSDTLVYSVVIPTSDENSAIYTSFSASSSFFDRMDKLSDSTFEYLNDETGTVSAPTPVHITGKVSKIDSEFYDYLVEYTVNDIELFETEAEAKASLSPYIINYYEMGAPGRGFIIGGVMAAIGILLGVIGIALKKKEKAAQESNIGY